MTGTWFNQIYQFDALSSTFIIYGYGVHISDLQLWQFTNFMYYVAHEYNTLAFTI